MNVVIINKSDATGGAAVVSYRLMNALRDRGIEASMLVTEKLTDSPYVHLAMPEWIYKIPFTAERLHLLLTPGVTRQNLFKIDTASLGLPLYRNPLVKEADIICLNWVNQGMLSLNDIRNLMSLGKPIVWTMHDMWCFTGICHHAGDCRHFEQECGECPLLGKGAKPDDISKKTLLRKADLYKSEKPIHFVAVSNWLADLARHSTLLRDMPLSVIGNAFPVEEGETAGETGSISGGIVRSATYNQQHSTFNIVFGAARLDDPVKGLPILLEAIRILKRKYPREADRITLKTFGNLKNPDALQGIPVRHQHLGHIQGEDNIRRIYANADAVVSTSLYETLPGTIVEGQVYGCVPVAFDRGGQKDIIDHLETGYLAQWDDDHEKAAENIADGIAWAMNQSDSELTDKMLASVRNKFDARKIADKYIELFKKLL